MRFTVTLTKDDIDRAVILLLAERGLRAKVVYVNEMVNGTEKYIAAPTIRVDLEEIPIIKHSTTPYR